jgi:hypothetical protein
VRKYGQRTGLTYGMVDSVFLTLKVDGYVYPNQIGIVPDLTRNWEFGDNGDSGSVIVNNALNAIGLLVARGMDGKYCAATPIQAVLDELDVDIYEEELSGFDKDIDDFMRSLIMPPPPLTGDIRRLLYGELVNGCCCDRS